jgi:hypothetical protein
MRFSPRGVSRHAPFQPWRPTSLLGATPYILARSRQLPKNLETFPFFALPITSSTRRRVGRLAVHLTMVAAHVTGALEGVQATFGCPTALACS